MTEFEREQLYRRLAQACAETEGRNLQAQAQNPPPVPDTTLARLDKRVRAAVNGSGAKRRASRMLAGIAAVLALALGLYAFRAAQGPGLTVDNGITDSIDAPAEANTAAGNEGAAPGEASGSEDALLPLGFVLPQEYTVADVELDNGLTVYTLENERAEPVVVTLDPQGNTGDYANLHKMDIGGTPPSTAVTPDYSLLALEKNGVGYQLSWAFELSPLVALAQYIV